MVRCYAWRGIPRDGSAAEVRAVAPMPSRRKVGGGCRDLPEILISKMGFISSRPKCNSSLYHPSPSPMATRTRAHTRRVK